MTASTEASPSPPAPSRRRIPRLVRSLAVTLAMAYAAICAFMFLAQDGLLFHPTGTSPERVRALVETTGAEPVRVAREGGPSTGLFAPGRGEGARPTVLIFGGNAAAVLEQLPALESVRAHGWNLLAVPYRGYDGNPGDPSAAAILADALAVYDAAAARPDVDASRIVPWGTSLGSGVAAYVATRRPVAGAILFAPYTRLSRVAGDQYPWLPVSLLFRHEIPTEDWAADANAPALIVHGDRDEVIDVAHGRALATAWPGATLTVVPDAPHNGLWEHAAAQRAVHAYLDARR